MRLLHLITDTPRPSDMLLAWVYDSLAAVSDARAWTLGPAELGERFPTFSLNGDPVAHRHFAAGSGIGRTFTAVLRLRQAAQADRPDVIHAWSLHAAAVAAAACPETPIVLTHSTASDGDGAALPWWMRQTLRGAAPRLTWLGPHLPSDGLARLGLSDGRSLRIDPPVNVARFNEAPQRERQRLSWGVTQPATRVVVMLSDQEEHVEAMSALLGVGLAWETGRDVKVLISPRTGELERALRVMRDVGRIDRVIIDEAADQPWRLAHAVDAALVLGDGQSLAWATNAGLPTLVPSLDGVPDGEAGNADILDAIFARPTSSKPGRIAPHLCRLCDQFDQAERSASALKAVAQEVYDVRTYRRRLAGVYQSVAAGERVSWIEPAQGQVVAG
ncbi:MAG: glycosyltransferase [Phycisphaeraceae bacterium]